MQIGEGADHEHTGARGASGTRRREQGRRLVDRVFIATDRHVDGRGARVNEPQVASGDLLTEEEEGFWRHLSGQS